MPGMRKLSVDEQERMAAQAKCRRDRLLFLLPVHTGFRISEILSLRVRDVYQRGAVLPEITIMRRDLKNGRNKRKNKRIRSRTVPVTPALALEIELLIAEFKAAGELHPNRRLFATRESGPWKSMIYCRAQQIWKQMADDAGVFCRVNTHSGRKTFAADVYELTGHDLVATKAALGHAEIATTISYLESTGTPLAEILCRRNVAGGAPKLQQKAAPASDGSDRVKSEQPGTGESLAS